MAAKPALHIFPPVEEVHKRRESLDELIRRSMDLRPTGPWPAKNDNHGVQPKYTNPKLKATGGKSPTNVEAVVIKIDAGNAAPVAGTTQDRATARPQRPNPYPLQVTTAAAPRQRSASTSPTRARPQRRPSVTTRQRGPSPAPATIPEGVVANIPYTNPFLGPSPISPEETAGPMQKSTRFQDGVSTVQYQRNIPSRSSSRQTGVSPITPDSSDDSVAVSPPERHASSRASSRVKASPISGPKRHVSSRVSNRRHVVMPSSPVGSRVISPTPSEQTIAVSGSPMLLRSNSIAKLKKSPVSPDVPMQSMFPTYDHSISLQRQTYRPANIMPPSAILAAERISKPQYSPTFDKEMPPKPVADLSTAAELGSLWNVANGNVNAPNPKTFTMKMYRPEAGAKKQKITFGPDESKPFYSLSQSHPTSVEEDPLHELLVFRHSPSTEDILPICHHMLNPPPPPSLSKAQRSSDPAEIREPAVCITNITPIIATLHSLDSAAKTKEAHTLALVDPRATSPAAAKLAERAVADAIAREACTLAWTRVDPKKGKYELHHPSLGVFTVVVEGNVKAAFEQPNGSRVPSSIYITNPFASLTPQSAQSANSGSSFYSGDAASLTSSTRRESIREQAVLARLDFQDDTLHIDAAQIQQLGNIYLIDMCVAALLSAAVAETQRPDDPGLVFAAPPPSPFALGMSKSAKKKAAKAAAKYVESEEKARVKEAGRRARFKRRTLTNGEGMDLSMAGIQHLTDVEDLPRLTRGILSVLGLSFKTAVWIMGIGVRLMAHMVVGVSKVVAKDGL